MTTVDLWMIAGYFLLVFLLGFWYQRRAAQNLDAYFLGGRKMHWSLLAMSGSVSNFDITGTMWIVSMLFLMGMRSMWIHWMWGVMMGAFFMAYMGKWVRRSKVMTGAEWMLTRFGGGPGGKAARMTSALVAVVTMCGMIGYDFQGIGKFAHVYIPGVHPHLLALGIMGATTLYVMAGGLYSVVITDVFQTVVLTVAALCIAVIAYRHVSPDSLAAALPADWASLTPKWRLEEFAGTENAGYELFGMLLIVWIAKGLLLNAGGPGGMYEFQRFLAARDARDAAKVGAAWSLFMVVRWAMAMGIALLAMTAFADLHDPEQAMPSVLHRFVPPGLMGIVMAGLLSAFMSTFSSTVNSGASYLVRDFWQPYFAKSDDGRLLIRVSYAATVIVVVLGIFIGFQAKSIAQIWEWLMTALGAGVIIPNVLRWYWWRMNGWGYAAGAAAGTLLAFVPLLLPESYPMYVVFPPIVAGSLLATVAGTLLTPAVPVESLAAFYRNVRPFGLWGPVRAVAGLSPAETSDPRESASRALLNTLLGMVAVTGLYLAPMYLVGHWHGRALACLAAAAAAMTALVFTWYRYLPARETEQ